MAPIVDCPICGQKSEFSPANRWRPFCCERCKMIDLGVWATGGYAVGGDQTNDDQADDSVDDGEA
ncbi:MAG: DNA gyrase inhibitor YacG [Burkholderiales bacterium]